MTRYRVLTTSAPQVDVQFETFVSPGILHRLLAWFLYLATADWLEAYEARDLATASGRFTVVKLEEVDIA